VIDVTIPKAKDFDDFLRLMEAAGYEIKRGKYISFRAPGQERFTRSKTLGEAYTVEAITERIAGTYRAKPKALRQEKAGVSMLIDIQNSIKAAESKGYEQWAKIHNLKQAAKTLNFLTEHDISEYEQLQAAKNGGKLPDFKTLHMEYKELTEKKDKLYQEYGKLKKKVKQYDTIKQNVDSILRQAKQPEWEKQTER
jgi:small-conductance mechanosensitive channel